ncbi:MAG: methyltransferase domain-containing protein [Magnetococcales bacterium]|nr:methyltransferase domain-containing protein [Magnetococcales bacterium]
MRKVLNVGGNSKDVPIPPHYADWQHILLDIDPAGNPDVICDARELLSLPGSEYDSIYCSHNLEHYYQHDVEKVLKGFMHLLKPSGFAFIRVPDMGVLMRKVAEDDLDLDDKLSPGISVRGFIYGTIEPGGSDFWTHKTGFTRKTLSLALQAAGFPWVAVFGGNLSIHYTSSGMEIVAFAFKEQPDEYTSKLLDLPGLLTLPSRPL